MDTGGFRFANTNQRVLEIAGELVAAGANPAYIAEQAYESATPGAIQLLAQVLGTIRFFADNRLASAELTQTMFNETGTSPVDSEGIINHLRSVKSVLLAMLFREDEDGVIHVSLRSKGPVDVATFAKGHGGGGHRHAAAFRLSGKMAEVRTQITQEGLSYLPGSERS
jgi:phosphoesterase RecJ-like protein